MKIGEWRVASGESQTNPFADLLFADLPIFKGADAAAHGINT
jgi:hypothetical protein